jgi:transcriptional regulator with XRE-family HTH domain
MESKDNRHSDIDAILKGIFKETSLRDIFDKRLHELKITQTAAQKMLGIERRTLNGILDGTQKRVNYKSLQKLAVFLNMPQDEVYESVASLLDKNFAEENTPTNKKKFIQENFDLVVLKKAGFIDTITDFNRIEERIVSYFGFNSIFEYKKRAFSTAFFVGVSTPKTTTTRDFWLTNARGVAAKIDNPYPYDRQKLIDYFPQIRWNSTNVELGLVNVIKSLFKLGVTVLFQAPMSALQLRGATMSVNNKPCVVMTDYKGFYPTLWHSLIHEL